VSIDEAHVLIIFVDFNVRWYSISVDITQQNTHLLAVSMPNALSEA